MPNHAKIGGFAHFSPVAAKSFDFTLQSHENERFREKNRLWEARNGHFWLIFAPFL